MISIACLVPILLLILIILGFIDYGTTDHMVRSVNFLTRITHCVSSSVKLPNADCVPIIHIGEVQLSASTILTDVMCISSFSFNLLSVSKLASNDHCCVAFVANHCFLQDLIT